MTISIVLFLVPVTITALRILHLLLGKLLWMLFLFCALTLGRAFGLIFFAFSIGPILIIEKLFSSPQSPTNKTKSQKKERILQRVIDKGELAGWVRVRICNTDSISELELDEGLDEGLEESGRSRAGSEDGSRGAKLRLQMMGVVYERERGIQRWLENLKREKDEDLRVVVVEI